MINRKIVIVISLISFLVSTLIGVENGAALSKDKTLNSGIDWTIKEWFHAMKRGDTSALVSLVTEDAEFWTHGASKLKGKAQIKAVFEKFFLNYSNEQRFIEVERKVFGKWAFIRGIEINIMTPKAGGASRESRQRAFSILRLEPDGRWRFARGMTNKGPKKSLK